MPDIGWMELLVIGVVALIVVGPKDLPKMFRKLGQFTGRMRAMARDFQRAMDDAADETGLTEINRDLRRAASYASNPKKAGMSALKDTLGDDFDLDPTKYEEGSETRRIAEEKVSKARKLRDELDARTAAKAAAAAPEATAVSPVEPKAAPKAARKSPTKSAKKAASDIAAEAAPVEPTKS
jgi:sec-independent protein translocase protein TatB